MAAGICACGRRVCPIGPVPDADIHLGGFFRFSHLHLAVGNRHNLGVLFGESQAMDAGRPGAAPLFGLISENTYFPPLTADHVRASNKGSPSSQIDESPRQEHRPIHRCRWSTTARHHLRQTAVGCSPASAAPVAQDRPDSLGSRD